MAFFCSQRNEVEPENDFSMVIKWQRMGEKNILEHVDFFVLDNKKVAHRLVSDEST